MKKIVALILTFVMVCSIAVISFAKGSLGAANATATDYELATSTDAGGNYDKYGYDSEGNYNYAKDSRLNFGGTYREGIEVYGGDVTAYYQLSTKKILAADPMPTVTIKKNVPAVDEETGEPKVDEEGNTIYEEQEVETPLVDATSVNPIKAECVTLQAYYGAKCTECGKAIGGTNLYLLYSQSAGNCPHCGEKIAPYDDMTFYRFIMVKGDEDNTNKANSAHYDIFKHKDFTLVPVSCFKDTEDDYGEGRDLPQKAIVWEKYTDEKTGQSYTRMLDFNTGLVKVKFESWDAFGDYLLAGLKLFAYNLLFNLEYVYVSTADNVVYETISNGQARIIIPFLKAIDRALTFIVNAA